MGAKGRFALVVAPQHLADQFKDATLPPVLATPVMIIGKVGSDPICPDHP